MGFSGLLFRCRERAELWRATKSAQAEEFRCPHFSRIACDRRNLSGLAGKGD